MSVMHYSDVNLQQSTAAEIRAEILASEFWPLRETDLDAPKRIPLWAEFAEWRAGKLYEQINVNEQAFREWQFWVKVAQYCEAKVIMK